MICYLQTFQLGVYRYIQNLSNFAFRNKSKNGKYATCGTVKTQNVR
jgi:hypothetical protein